MNNQKREVRQLKWIFGTTYAVQGSSALSEIPTLYFLKFVLEVGEAGGQLFQSLKAVGWLLKPLWGFLSDRFPLFGYRRKSWFILMALLGLAFWALNAFLSSIGVRVPIVYLIGFNLAFTTYAFVDVVGDAIMVEHGRRLKRVGSFVNFQWTLLALSNAAVTLISGWFQEKIQAGELAYWMIFLATGIPPLFTAVVGLLNIPEDPLVNGSPPKKTATRTPQNNKGSDVGRGAWLRPFLLVRNLARSLRKSGEVMVLLVLFIIMWNFSPSIGYVERSYLIDTRGFTPTVFATVLSAQALTFLVSILAYRLVTHWYPSIRWYQYLYAMIAVIMVAFPLNFFLYLDPDHPWWQGLMTLVSFPWDPLPDWNRYMWFRVVFGVVFGFVTIPAFIIPLRLAGEAVKIETAGMSYAFLTALTNATNLIEGVAGSGLYWLFSKSWMKWLLDGFARSPFNIAETVDERTLILQMFVYISMLFTLLAAPFVYLLQRAFARHGIVVVDKNAGGGEIR